MAKNNKTVQKKADSKRAGKRTRNWTAIFYPEDLPENWTSIINEHHFKWIQSPFHDKDINPDGTPKKAHYHVLFLFNSVKNKEQVIALLQGSFGASDTGSTVGVSNPQQVSDAGGLVRYMAHIDNPEKHQYEVGEIIGHNGADVAIYLRATLGERYNYIREMMQYIRDNDITEYKDLLNYAMIERFEDWFPLLCDNCTYIIETYIKSVRNSTTKKIENLEVDKNTGEVKE